MVGGWGAVHFRPDTKGGGDLVCCSNLRLFARYEKRGRGECIAAGRVRLSTPCIRKLSKAERACIRHGRAIVKFTSIAVVELLSRSSRY